MLFGKCYPDNEVFLEKLEQLMTLHGVRKCDVSWHCAECTPKATTRPIKEVFEELNDDDERLKDPDAASRESMIGVLGRAVNRMPNREINLETQDDDE